MTRVRKFKVNVRGASTFILSEGPHLIQEVEITLLFVLKEKIEEAKRLLRYTDKSLNAIAAYLGFSSQSHFANTFRKYSGKSPSEFRKLYGDQ